MRSAEQVAIITKKGDYSPRLVAKPLTLETFLNCARYETLCTSHEVSTHFWGFLSVGTLPGCTSLMRAFQKKLFFPSSKTCPTSDAPLTLLLTGCLRPTFGVRTTGLLRVEVQIFPMKRAANQTRGPQPAALSSLCRGSAWLGKINTSVRWKRVLFVSKLCTVSSS